MRDSSFKQRSCLGKIGCLLLIGWIIWLIIGLVRLLRLLCRDQSSRPPSGTIPSFAQRQPDPLIYSQSFLMSQGFAVTWQNPDIHLELASNPGTAVDSLALLPDTAYIVVARIWNGSATAPVAQLPVRFGWLEFGIATIRHEIGVTYTDLSVKGGSACPAFASIPWRTPEGGGHYCLVAELLWTDDAQPGNNIGQHNTVVKPLNSPHAAFNFKLRNPGPGRRRILLQADAYQIPRPLPCPEEESDQARERRRAAAIRRNARNAWPVPEGWLVVFDPQEVVLDETAEREIQVDITAPDGFRGRQAINVNAFDGTALLGGVTLFVDGDA